MNKYLDCSCNYINICNQEGGVGENFPHVFGVTGSVATVIGAEPL